MNVYSQLTKAQLVEHAIQRREGVLAANGALSCNTGVRTGRSPKDRFIVDDSTTHNTVDWGQINLPIEEKVFAALWDKAQTYLTDKDRYVSRYHVGASHQHYLPVEVTTELAWHQAFAQNMFINPEQYNPLNKDVWQVLNVPKLTCDPEVDGTNSDATVMVNFTERKVLLVGMHYGGEMKKAMFAVQNYLLPEVDVLPMHCSANVGGDGDTVLFFGLSGTGKTTLSADPERFLIGDDEHGWSDHDVFNFEGGCYAKTIDLTRDNEPVIFDAIRFDAVLENVMIGEDRVPDYFDTSLSQNGRVAYPLAHVPGQMPANKADVPKHVIFLTCDLNGVLPPVAVLDPNAAAYHFLSGYTALVGSTEVGAGTGVKETFSTCFGAPFFPRNPSVYAELLKTRMQETGARVWLVNTGWTKGPFGEGRRFKIPETRAVIRAIVNDQLNDVPTEHIDVLNLNAPVSIPGVADELVIPRAAWADPHAYDDRAALLAERFQANFDKFDVAEEIVAAGPQGVGAHS
ncbi:phosphoenolpyruvate carboxykinase [Salinibius halmophilus]|uniref:phosphoenolpyruvate carboxykinase n=1 Tax=Salinibius halmophilus TaxID=1853216 RepID=UPI000E668230|nr:phosphoenolpyruvate carboxykinase [Salinibius halmophilus]